MAALSVTAASVIASAAATVRADKKFGATITAGQLVYLKSSTDQWSLVDSNANLGTGINDYRGITLNGGAINQPGHVVVADPDFTPGAALTNGIVVYNFATPGAITLAGDDIPAATITAGAFVTGKYYRIASAGTTNFALIGAADSNVGTEFTASGAGSGTGTAVVAGDYPVVVGIAKSTTKMNLNIFATGVIV